MPPRLFSILLLVLLFSAAAAVAKEGRTCSTDGDCGAGQHCDGCSGQATRCISVRPIDPQTKGKRLPFNRYSWLTTHNSFALRGQPSATGAPLIAPTNQIDNVTAQLNNGVRGLMLDMYDFQNDIWLCHSFGGNCYNFTAFQPAINVLREIQAFLETNPSEVITIFIEDYVTSPQGLTKVFTASGLMKYWFPVSKMPKNGGDWPLLSDMISQNHRLLVFTSKSAKEASEGIAYEWQYVVENKYGNDGTVPGTCTNRGESSPMNTTSKSLVLMNYFETNPNLTSSCSDNSDPLLSMLKTCHKDSGGRWPNFIAVDFYTKSFGGGAQEATDVANGHSVCGCDNIAYCKANSTFGTCVVPPPDAPSPNPSTTGDVQNSSEASSLGGMVWLSGMVPMLMILLL